MTDANATTTVTCPRCHGFDNAFERFGHVAQGRCLKCLGAKTIEMSTAKLNAQRAEAVANADAYYSKRPYCVAVDGMETCSLTFPTWEAAREWIGEGVTSYSGQPFRIAKWDGERHRYRDGTPVEWHTSKSRV